MSEADDKRLAIIRNAVENTGYVNCEPDRAFLLRLLDAAREENARLERELERARGISDTEIALLDRATRAETALAASDGEKASLQECVTDWQDRAVAAETALAEALEAIREYVEAERGIGITYFSPADAWAACERQRLACNKLHEIAALTPPSPDGSETETPDV